jgi:NADH-quinone oxidoreductase subunit N
LLTKLLYVAFYGLPSIWQNLLYISGLFSCFWGCFGGIYQRRIKRLVAYSGIANIGLVCLALNCNSLYGMSSALSFVILYTFLLLPLFASIFIMTTSTFFPKFILNWITLTESNFFFSAFLGLVLASMAGIPPLAGFYVKLTVLLALVDNNCIYTVCLIMILSCISAFYYFRLIKILFFSKDTGQKLWLLPQSNITSYIAVLILGFTSFFFIKPTPFAIFGTLVVLSLV